MSLDTVDQNNLFVPRIVLMYKITTEVQVIDSSRTSKSCNMYNFIFRNEMDTSLDVALHFAINVYIFFTSAGPEGY